MMNRNNLWSHRFPDPCLNRGNEFFILPEENIAAATVSSSIAYHNTIPSSNTNFPSTSNSDLVNRGTANLGVSCDPYISHSSVSRSCLIPQIYAHGGSYYDQLEIRGSTSASNSEADHERAYFKRKPSAHPMAFDMINSDEYYSARRSNGLSISSDQYMSNPILGNHTWPHSSISMLPGYTSIGTSTIGEGSGTHRNVRSRHSHALYLENNLVAPHASNSQSHNFHQTGSTSSHVAMPLDSRRRFPSSGFFHQEINQPIASSGADAIMEISGELSSNLFSSRHTATSLPTLPGIPTRDDFNHGQRLNHYSSSSRYTNMGLPGTLENVRQFGYEVAPHLRIQRQSSMLGQSSRRMRGFYDGLSYRMNTLEDEGHAHGRWNAEDAVMIDRSVFYDPPAMFDQHRNMRMDIDSMSYEQLVDLGERIGNVSTGLSEDDIARCLRRITYSFDRSQNSEEGSCVICLEEYKDGQSMGRLDCRHDFHARCIKKWLLIKNACPICKSAALGDKVRGKQVLLM